VVSTTPNGDTGKDMESGEEYVSKGEELCEDKGYAIGMVGK